MNAQTHALKLNVKSIADYHALQEVTAVLRDAVATASAKDAGLVNQIAATSTLVFLNEIANIAGNAIIAERDAARKAERGARQEWVEAV